MKIGFFGGSFDPIHFGHLHLAIQLFEKKGLDRLLFSPVFCSPFKQSSPPVASPKDRYQMVRLAVEKIPFAEVSSFEIESKKISYTIEAISYHFKKNDELYLLLFEDSAKDFFSWKEAEKLLEMITPLIGIRSIDSLKGLPEKLHPYTQIISYFDLSSTYIRSRLEQDLYVGHLVPSETLSYIQARRLYQK